MSGFFIRLMKFTRDSEDVFTECLAETLRSDRELAGAFLEKFCGQQIEGADISEGTIAVETQVPFDGSTLDMVFHVGGRVNIGVENKVHSPEGKGGGRKTQLKKYLKLVDAGKLSGLAYVTGYYTNVSKEVAAHPKYLCVRENGRRKRDHFMWMDFYPMVEKRSSEAPGTLATALAEVLANLGFEPPSPEVGDLHDPDAAVRRRNQDNFAHFWDLTRMELKRCGWEWFEKVDRSGLYAGSGPAIRLREVYINPNYEGCLQFILTFKRGTDLRQIVDDIEGLEAVYGAALRTRVAQMRRAGRVRGTARKVQIVKVSYPLRKLVEDRERIPESLARIVMMVIEKAG